MLAQCWVPRPTPCRLPRKAVHVARDLNGFASWCDVPCRVYVVSLSYDDALGCCVSFANGWYAFLESRVLISLYAVVVKHSIPTD